MRRYPDSAERHQAARRDCRLSVAAAQFALCGHFAYRLFALIAARARQADERKAKVTLTWKVLMAVVCYDPALCSAYRGVYTYIESF